MASDPAIFSPLNPPPQPLIPPGQRSRKVQFFLVIAIAFALPILSSLIVFFGHRPLHAATPGRTLATVIFQLISLLCLYVALRYQKRNLKDIGVRLPMRIAEVGHSFGLFFGAFPAALAVIILLYAVFGHSIQRTFNDSALFGNHIALTTVLFVFLNPFHEELIVRAFLITEMEHFYKSTALAVFVSVFIQSSYHLYQGLPAALIHASTFLLFSIYFVRTRRILPVIMAHMFLDVSALALYARHLTK